jgi:2-polyprenyl-3-methyl-5-hydroxy-6-metoxy-1,4-benzoquinol methylase
MPIPVNGFDQHYEQPADEYFAHHETNLKSSSALALLDQAAKLVGGKGRLLDIGAGRGELVRAAANNGWDVIGIEPSASHAEYAARAGANIKREPLEKCEFQDSSFSVVILAAVLEHLYNPDETIMEISRILRPGGALFVDVPNEQGLYFKIGNFYQKVKNRNWVINLAPTFSPFHVFGFGPKSLRKLLAKYDFEVRTWHVYGGTSFVPNRSGAVGLLEQQAAKLVTLLSNLGNLGTYIETWAIKN